MKHLYNGEDWRVLKKRMIESDHDRVTVSFYQYAKLDNPPFFRDYLFINWDKLGIFGRIYVAHEGINAQLSVPREKFEDFRDHLYNINFLNGVRLNVAIDDDGMSFYKLIIKVRPKILADGLNDETFDVTDKGKHLKAEEFNDLIEKDDTILIDMRNHYETEVGHFKNAITPDVDTFRDSLPYILGNMKGLEDKNVVMYCTGGIRCEKASAWLKHQGFPNVHQLEGGIIEYTRRANEKGIDNNFVGKNFVFDERMAEGITRDVIARCHQCGEPDDTHVNCLNKGCHTLFIQCSNCTEKYEGCCSTDCQEVILLSKVEQKEHREGKYTNAKIYKKGRSPHIKFKTLHNPLKDALKKFRD
ncbi:MAG: UPF0176 protein [Cryomorphaceae bacterium]|jgi:UPF0176 protein